MELDKEILQVIRTLSPNSLPAMLYGIYPTSKLNSPLMELGSRDKYVPGIILSTLCEDRLYSSSDDCIKCKYDLQLWTLLKVVHLIKSSSVIGPYQTIRKKPPIYEIYY
ncbi:15894_t:CDS:2 [Dentiscutata erythropus]|uniref:15894_t:CDS:1 n=1 Tax=Dentiscutata erythropus TaxID=1348616 RepID=A0A9N9B7R5_9GLOM|nr:15894_t:CDS:2 [Dentiscutata erythropus]